MFKVSYTSLSDAAIKDGIEKLDNLILKVDTLPVDDQYKAINLASDVLLKVANRDNSVETIDLLSSYMKSINNVLNTKSSVLINSQNSYNSSIK